MKFININKQFINLDNVAYIDEIPEYLNLGKKGYEIHFTSGLTKTFDGDVNDLMNKIDETIITMES